MFGCLMFSASSFAEGELNKIIEKTITSILFNVFELTIRLACFSSKNHNQYHHIMEQKISSLVDKFEEKDKLKMNFLAELCKFCNSIDHTNNICHCNEKNFNEFSKVIILYIHSKPIVKDLLKIDKFTTSKLTPINSFPDLLNNID